MSRERLPVVLLAADMHLKQQRQSGRGSSCVRTHGSLQEGPNSLSPRIQGRGKVVDENPDTVRRQTRSPSSMKARVGEGE